MKTLVIENTLIKNKNGGLTFSGKFYEETATIVTLENVKLLKNEKIEIEAEK